MKSPSIIFLFFIAGACRDEDVAFTVGATPVFKGEIASASAGADQTSVHRLVDQALLAEASREAKLERDPSTKAQLNTARREILAHAYLEKEIVRRTTEATLRDEYDRRKSDFTYRQVHVRHIIVRLPVEPSRAVRNAAETKINKTYARLRAGEAFDLVAKEVSEDPPTAERGGDLGVIREGSLDARFTDRAFALEPKGLSAPFETGFGFHVVQALSPVESILRPFEEVRDSLLAKVRHEVEQETLERLRKETRIDGLKTPSAAVPAIKPQPGSGREAGGT
jgi:peptidyl-prolyl cis-trans isomerase C